jgi:hypothetical protein
VGEGGLSFALEHSKVCTLCDFGHLQFFKHLFWCHFEVFFQIPFVEDFYR